MKTVEIKSLINFFLLQNQDISDIRMEPYRNNIVSVDSGDLPGGGGSQGEHWGPRWSLLRGGVQEKGDHIKLLHA